MTALVTDPVGYSLAVCTCPRGPHLGARKAETPCCCEDCGFITADQLDAIRSAVLAPLADFLDGIEDDARRFRHLARISTAEVRKYMNEAL